MPVRMHFERGVLGVHPGMVRRSIGHSSTAAVSYRLRVPVPEYEPRQIELLFTRTTPSPRLLAAYADGPIISPHRWAPRKADPKKRPHLCIWHPDDPPERQWDPAAGLLSLIGLTQIHLIKEAHYRETGEWLGEEVLHTATGRKPS